MLVKGFKKTLLALSVALLLVSAALAAPKDSALVGGKEDAASEYTKTTPDRLEITYKGIFKRGNSLEAYYTIESKKDTRISIEFINSWVQDDNDTRINWDNGYEHNRKNIGAGVYINSKDKPKDYEEIVADQPYPVTIRYWVDGGYLLTPRYKSATIAVNGLLTEFKDVPVAP